MEIFVTIFFCGSGKIENNVTSVSRTVAKQSMTSAHCGIL